MNLPLYIAKRYLASKKKHNAINIISAVSVCGVALATMAMVCTLSVFNGFQEMVEGLFTAFDPQLKITARQGKTFDPSGTEFQRVKALPEIEVWMESVEENAMAQYKSQQAMVTIKGVEDSFEQLTDIDSILIGNRHFMLEDEVVCYGIMGIGVAETLGSGIGFVDPLTIYAPKHNATINIANPSAAFSKDYLYSPGNVFIVNQEKYDSRYVIVPLSFARRLFRYDKEVTSIELRLAPDADEDAVKEKIGSALGNRYIVQNRYEQQADVFRIMEIEKLISYFFLTFIVVIACFNIISTLSMLIMDKRDDVKTLRHLGADDRLIRHIFTIEGWLVSLTGTAAGIVLGLALCWAQKQFGLISMGSDFIVNAYPVSVHLSDILIVALTVTAVGCASVIYPVRYICGKLL